MSLSMTHPNRMYVYGGSYDYDSSHNVGLAHSVEEAQQRADRKQETRGFHTLYVEEYEVDTGEQKALWTRRPYTAEESEWTWQQYYIPEKP